MAMIKTAHPLLLVTISKCNIRQAINQDQMLVMQKYLIYREIQQNLLMLLFMSLEQDVPNSHPQVLMQMDKEPGGYGVDQLGLHLDFVDSTKRFVYLC